MKRPWRKLIPRAIVFLLLGAIVNVAVAASHEFVSNRNAAAMLALRVNPGTPPPPRTVRVLPHQGWEWVRFGKPLPAVRRHLRFGESNVSFVRQPELPGFAINTLFYAAILWLLWFTPGVIRRRVRIKRGRCPACGYPIGTSAVCTECGAALPAAT